jgi:serine/threonine protein kinase
MTTLLKPNQSLTTPSGLSCTVQQLLGSGGQGEVFRALLGNQPFALKWYHPGTVTPEQRDALAQLVKKGPPSEHFLWPLELVTDRSEGLGYLMPLRPSRFRSATSLVRRTVDVTFRILATIGFNLAQGFLQLHARGLCYRDISFGNVFFDPATGDVLICDNDNVGIDGKGHAGVLGTPKFMAPEIVCRQASPSTQTDLHSLAVLLFYLFFLHHPLDGEKEYKVHCLDLSAMTRLYGTEPVFIFDPVNTSNRPVPGAHDNALTFWALYPQFLLNLFTRAFTDGLRDPVNARVRESEWRAALVRLRDGIVYCPACQAEICLDPLASDRRKAPPTCWSCRQPVQLPLILIVGRHAVMLNHNARLYPHHVDDQKPYDFSRPVLALERHPQDPNRWGLRNLSDRPWQATTVDGRAVRVEPGRAIDLQLGLRIQFGRAEGKVRPA